MNAVVTGSAGFIGGHLVDALIDRGYLVFGIDRESRFESSGYQHSVLDLACDPDRSGLSELVGAADVVFHLAARPGVRGAAPGLEAARRRDNVIAVRNLLSVTPSSIPVVATSSSAVYGGSSDGSGSREDQPLRPRGGYARSKVEMERLCQMHRAGGGVVAVVRPFTVAGELQRPDMAFSLWLEALWKREPIQILGSPNRSRDITDVREVVKGLITAGERRINETVNLGTGVTHRLVDMAQVLIEVTGRDAEIVVRPGSSEEVEVTVADTSRCSRLLGFVPRTDLPSLVARQVEAATPVLAMVAT
jgi:nucleoside-diphosphate-sugar epimerase